MELHSTKSAREKTLQKYTIRINPGQQQLEWDVAIKEADEALGKKPIDRKLAFINKHSSNPIVPKSSHKSRPLVDDHRNEFDDFDNHVGPFDLGWFLVSVLRFISSHVLMFYR